MISTLSDRDRAVQQCFPALLSKIAALFLVIVTKGEAQQSSKKKIVRSFPKKTPETKIAGWIGETDLAPLRYFYSYRLQR
jgi:hypothetical protein